MKRFLISVALAALAVLSSSCDKSMMEKMQLAENVDIQCTPELLGIGGGQIPATVTVTCPKGHPRPRL